MFIKADWPAPANVNAYTTLRKGGVSETPFDQLNLAQNVGDNPEQVDKNRSILKQELKLPADPIWINQTHSTIAIPANIENTGKEADASYTALAEQVCIITTADCLPLLVCNRKGTHVAAIHAGWRGLSKGVIENTLNALNLPPEDILVWLGPAIGPKHYEVGDEVRDFFLQIDPEASKAFTPSINQRWLADLYTLARLRLKKLGISAVYGGKYCTYSDPENFYSYRRDGNKTGRMASLIWLNDSSN